MKCPTNQIPFLFFISLSLSALVSALHFIHPEDVKESDTYSLTLYTNPTRALDSKNGQVVVETFDAVKRWNAEDVGPDNGKRWRFKDHLNSLFCEGGGGFLKGRGGYVAHQNQPLLSSHALLPWDSNISLIPSGGGVKIKVFVDGREHRAWRWVDEFGYLTGDNSAIWMITKTTNRADFKRDRHIRELD